MEASSSLARQGRTAHVDRTEKVSHRIWSWSAARRAAEVAKCVVRCRDCHRRKTDRENAEILTKPFLHGTMAGYRKGCRCPECQSAQHLYRIGLVRSYQPIADTETPQPKLPMAFRYAGDKFTNGWLTRQSKAGPSPEKKARRMTSTALGHTPRHRKAGEVLTLPLFHSEAA